MEGDQNRNKKSPSLGREVLEGGEVIYHANRLCGPCLSILNTSKILTNSSPVEPDDIREDHDHYACLEDLRRSALEGCHSCSLLFSDGRSQKYLRNQNWFQPLQTPNMSYKMRIIRSSEVDFFAEILLVFKEEEGLPNGFRSYVSCRPSDGDAGYHNSKLMSSTLRYDSTSSDATFDQISTWLSSCINAHSKCKVGETRRVLPTRLIAVHGDEDCVRLRLCTTADLDRNVQYLTLSHCWGEIRFPKLCKESVEKFGQQINVQELPKTFIDAAHITYRLGYRYIWIDSLCIIQDSNEDWNNEAARMGEIYRNSALTIAAMSSTDGLAGCFRRRNPLQFFTCRLCQSDGTQLFLIDHANVHMASIEKPDQPVSSVLPAPALLQRAWVVQESALAHRTLYYGNEMVFWECLELKASEREPIKSKSYLGQNCVKQAFDELFAAYEDSEHDRFYELWMNIVMRYTGAKLTFQSDRWVAISGLVAIVQKRLALEMVHGLWSSFLPLALAWFVENPGARLDNGRPTWSWLSLKAVIWPVESDRSELTSPSMQILSCCVSDLKGLKPDESSRSLSCRAPLWQFTWTRMERDPGICECLERSESFWFPDIEPLSNLETWAFQIEFRRPRATTGLGVLTYSGLVVTPTDPSKTRWRRIGYYRFFETVKDISDYVSTPEMLGSIETIILV